MGLVWFEESTCKLAMAALNVHFPFVMSLFVKVFCNIENHMR